MLLASLLAAALALLPLSWRQYVEQRCHTYVEAPLGVSTVLGTAYLDGNGRGVCHLAPGVIATLPTEYLALVLVHEASHVEQQQRIAWGVYPSGMLAEVAADAVTLAAADALGVAWEPQDVRRMSRDAPRAREGWRTINVVIRE